MTRLGYNFTVSPQFPIGLYPERFNPTTLYHLGPLDDCEYPKFPTSNLFFRTTTISHLDSLLFSPYGRKVPELLSLIPIFFLTLLLNTLHDSEQFLKSPHSLEFFPEPLRGAPSTS